MGYLDHSTNNIILDAVLTDYGRSKLASAGLSTNGNGGFVISKYALGDDEIDYTIIKKYGRTVGKEKIEKNTPIFEALTNESIALKYKLVGLSSSGALLQTTRLPIIDVVPSTSTASLSSTNNSIGYSVSLRYKGKTADDADLARDFGATSSSGAGSTGKKYIISMSDRFLTLAGSNKTSLGNDANRTATYNVSKTENSFSITLNANTIDNTTLQIYGNKSGSNYTIRTYVTVECLDVPAISKTFSVDYTATI